MLLLWLHYFACALWLVLRVQVKPAGNVLLNLHESWALHVFMLAAAQCHAHSCTRLEQEWYLEGIGVGLCMEQRAKQQGLCRRMAAIQYLTAVPVMWLLPAELPIPDMAGAAGHYCRGECVPAMDLVTVCSHKRCESQPIDFLTHGVSQLPCRHYETSFGPRC
jgi:hypothetical protein